MYKHFLILSSSYSTGKRIAMHYLLDGIIDSEMLLSELKTIRKICGESVSISTHFIETDSPAPESIAVKDGFFEDVLIVETLGQLVGMIMDDRELKGLDIAKYILSIKPCSHLELQKLVYLCYAEYLCETHKRLFNDTIYAFRYGPVIKSVYDKFKGTSGILDSYKELPIKSRILFAEDGLAKLSCIEKTLAKYGKYSASKLVDITHTPGGPWDSVDAREAYAEISDCTILENHKYEVAFLH